MRGILSVVFRTIAAATPIRKAAGLSLSELARMTGFSTGKLRDFENGMPGYCNRAVQKAYEAAARLRMAEIREVLS